MHVAVIQQVLHKYACGSDTTGSCPSAVMQASMISIHGAALVVASLVVASLMVVAVLLVVSVSSVVVSLLVVLTSVEFVGMLLVVSAVADSSITRVLLYPVTASGGSEFPTPH